MEKRHILRQIKIVWSVATIAVMAAFCNHVDRNINNGMENLQLGDYKRARKHFEAILDKQPSHYAARLGLGKAILQEFCAYPGDSTLLIDCLTQLEAARTLRPDKEVEKLLSVVWFKRATTFLIRHDTIGAIVALTRSIGFDPSASKPLNLAGILYFYRGESDKASHLFRMAMTIDSGSVTGFFNAGMVQWAQGNYALAYDYWYKAALRAPDDKEILTWAAMAKKKSQDKSR